MHQFSRKSDMTLFYVALTFTTLQDLMNRKVAMKLLVEHAAHDQQRRQYILFTPQDMSHFNKKFKNMKIMQLEAPERNND